MAPHADTIILTDMVTGFSPCFDIFQLTKCFKDKTFEVFFFFDSNEPPDCCYCTSSSFSCAL